MSRDASPGDSRKSRDPSPAERFGSSSSVYTPSYRLYPRSNTSSYSSKYGSNSSIPRSNSTTTDKALSYMSATEAKTRPVIRHKSPQIDKEDIKLCSEKDSDSSEIITDKSDVVLEIIEPGEMIQVTVVTRGTSPTPPSTSTFTRTRRADMAKTIEKTIQRPVVKPQSEDKEMQSDRMDDSTRYSRYGGSRVSSIPWSSYLDTKYSPSGYSRYGSTSSKYSRDSSSSKTDEKQTSPSKSKETSPISKSSTSLSRSGSLKSNGSKSKSSSIESKSKSPIKNQSKQKSPDSSKCLPPMSPKAESPSKTTSNSSSSILKWTNKDFRKSALNMGSPDRPRTNRSNSTDSDQNEYTTKTISDQPRRSERSQSSSSEVSSISTVSSLEEDSKQIKLKTSSRGSLKQTSSCDDLPTDKPTQKTDSLSKNDETKSFVSRAIAPVTKFFKNIKYNDSDDKSWLDTNSATSISENIKLDTELDGPITTTTDTIDSDFWASKESEQSLDMKYKLRHIDSGDRAWWLCSNENLVEAAKKEELSSKEPFELKLMKSDSSQSKSNLTETKSDVRKVYESDEKPWWMNNESESDKYKKSASTSSKKGFKFSLRHIESGETAWWLNDDSLKNKKKESSPESQISNSEEITNIDDTTYDIPPLGDRASPEGLEDDTQLGRISPYDNIPLKNSNLKDKPKLFISRHTNIDDLLGGSCHLLSPVMDRVTAKEFFEEITPDQVRIHDSTAQMPIIQRSTTDRFVSLLFLFFKSSFVFLF